MTPSFPEQIRELIRELKNPVSPPETMTENDVVRAHTVLNFIQYKTVADVFLGCAAVNLLNAYVKQKDAKIGYAFKLHLGPILNAIDQLGSFLVKVGYDDAKNMKALQIDICGFQFSYKSIERTDLVAELAAKMSWDGIRKQLYARWIFDFALASEWLGNLTLEGDDLRDRVAEDAIDYENGAFVFRQQRLVKVANINHKKRSLTILANYLRDKLRQADGELVLLEGNFAKVWDKHVTFTSIRPHISGINSVVVCDHINLLKNLLQACVPLDSLVKGNSYFILGYCKPYFSGGYERMGVVPATDLGHRPILPMTEFDRISNSTFQRLYRFPIDESIANKQKELIYR